MRTKFLLNLIINFLLSSLLLQACNAVTATPQGSQEITKENNALIPPEPEATSYLASSVQIKGAGATFPLPVYTEWMYAYQYIDPSVILNYQGIGSSGAKQGILDRTIDFAGTDSVLSNEDYARGGDLQMYPVLAGAVVLIYNLENYDAAHDPALVLDRQTLAGIYLGTINQWDDPSIMDRNPGLADKLTAKTITALHRSDGSGTTEIFTNAMATFSQEWQKKVGAGPVVEWPVTGTGLSAGSKGNQGVASTVRNTLNSIGYVELSYAIANQIPYAQMVNKAGRVVTADAKGIMSAMDDFSDALDDKLNTMIVDGSGEGSWPISGYTYVILHTKSMDDCIKAEKLLGYMRWTLTDPTAAKRASDMGYAVLPDSVRSRVLAKFDEVSCNNQPVNQ